MKQPSTSGLNQWPALLCILIIATLADKSKGQSVARWCTISSAEQSKCAAMSTAFADDSSLNSIQIICIAKSSPEECMSAIFTGQADLVTLDGGDIFSGGKKYKLKPIMEEIYEGGYKGYNAIAVAKKSNPGVNLRNLEGKKSCHTGYGRTAGWNLPVGFLLDEGLMTPVGCLESADSAAAFFSESCAPGVKDAAVGNVDNLCALCGGDCGRSTSIYQGYAGALRCLVETDADVAFIKPATVTDYTDGNSQEGWAQNLSSTNFEILCRDGSRRPLADHEDCHIAKSPSHAVVTSEDKSNTEVKSFQTLLSNAQIKFGNDENMVFTMFDSSAWNGADLLFKDTTSQLSSLTTEDYKDFLGDGYFNSLQGLLKCPDGTYRFCTTSELEQQKCKDMVAAVAGDVTLTELGALSCFPATSHYECVEYIESMNADLVTLDGGDLYTAGKDLDLIPILSENYGTGDASYWAVAVVKAGTSFSINDLQNKKSCHTGIMKTSGWIIPVGHLINTGQIPVTEDSCDVPAAVGMFFSESCVPGAKQNQYDPAGTNPDSLCSLCIGEENDYCVRNSAEPYYDYPGAFRCLADGAGDVAFVKHATAIEETADNPDWNKEDFELLCQDGTRKPIESYLECNLAKVSSHAVVTDGRMSLADIEAMQELLYQTGIRFGSDTGDKFKLFDSSDYEGGKNLLFKDSTQSLINVGQQTTYDTYLSEEYIKNVEALETCSRSATHPGSYMLLTLFVVLGTVMQWMIIGAAS